MTTFLESKVNEELYMTVLKGIVFLEEGLRVVSGPQVYATIVKGLYGFKQVSLN